MLFKMRGRGMDRCLQKQPKFGLNQPLRNVIRTKRAYRSKKDAYRQKLRFFSGMPGLSIYLENGIIIVNSADKKRRLIV